MTALARWVMGFFGLLGSACAAQVSASAPSAHVSIGLPIGTSSRASQLAVVQSLPFSLPTRQPGFRLIMLEVPQVIRGPSFKFILSAPLTGDLSLSYDFRTAPAAQGQMIEVYLTDGKTFDLIGRRAGRSVRQVPLDLRPYRKQAPKGLYIFAQSFTDAQYRQACTAAGGRFNGLYCGPR